MSFGRKCLCLTLWRFVLMLALRQHKKMQYVAIYRTNDQVVYSVNNFRKSDLKMKVKNIRKTTGVLLHPSSFVNAHMHARVYASTSNLFWSCIKIAKFLTFDLEVEGQKHLRFGVKLADITSPESLQAHLKWRFCVAVLEQLQRKIWNCDNLTLQIKVKNIDDLVILRQP